jgi:hypothetical protein
MPLIESMVWGKDSPRKAGFYFRHGDYESTTEVVELRQTETKNLTIGGVTPQLLGFMLGANGMGQSRNRIN